MRMRNCLSQWSRHTMIAACLVSLSGTFSGCTDEYLLDDEKPSYLSESIYGNLTKKGNFQTYLRLLSDPDVNTGSRSLVDILNKTGSKTVFAANDDAWKEFFANNATLPASNPWSHATSYENLSANQKKLLIHTSMLNNAIVMENLASGESSSNVAPERGVVMRRYTDVETTDSITKIMSEDIPFSYNKDSLNINNKTDRDYWARFRVGNPSGHTCVYLACDSVPSMMIHFTNEHMKKNSITDDDFQAFMRESRNTGDVYIYDSKIVNKDDICENGYVNETSKPLVPLANMAEVIRTNGQTNIFSHILERFSVPYYSKTLSTIYNQSHPEFTDSIFTKRYFSNASYGGSKTYKYYLIEDEKGNIFNDKGDAALKFDPGWNGYVYSNDLTNDMGAMFVPNDATFLNYFKNAGYALIKTYCKEYKRPEEYTLDNLETLYKDIDQVPLETIQSLLNNIMFYSFTGSVKSKMLKLKNDAQDQIFQQDDLEKISDCKLACNGAVYIMDKVCAPADFSAVVSPAYISNDKLIMRWAIYNGSTIGGATDYIGYNYYAYLKAMQSTFSFFLPTDAAMKYFYDTMSFATKKPRVVRFIWTGSGTFPLVYNMDSYKGEYPSAKYDVNTGKIGDPYTISAKISQDEIVNRLRDILESHTIVHETKGTNINDGDAEDGREYYITKNGTPIKVTRGLVEGENGQKVQGVVEVQGGFQLENEREGVTNGDHGTSLVNVEERVGCDNGYTYILDAPLIPASRSVYSVLANLDRSTHKQIDEGENNPFLKFYALCDSIEESLITGSGLVDESLYNTSTTTGKTQLQNAINKFKTFDNMSQKAPDYNVEFFNNYNYTIFVPTNAALEDAEDNHHLPTWGTITSYYEAHSKDGTLQSELLTAHDSLVVQGMITYLTNFIRGHFADGSVFDDKNSLDETDMITSSYDSTKGLFVKVHAKRDKKGDGAELMVSDNTSKSHWISVVPGYTNIMAHDQTANKKVPDAASLSGMTADSHSYATIHMINGVLNHTDLDANGDYPDFTKQSSAKIKAYLKRFSIR